MLENKLTPCFSCDDCSYMCEQLGVWQHHVDDRDPGGVIPRIRTELCTRLHFTTHLKPYVMRNDGSVLVPFLAVLQPVR